VEEVAARDFLAAEGHGWQEATGGGPLQGVCMAGSASHMPTVAANGSHLERDDSMLPMMHVLFFFKPAFGWLFITYWTFFLYEVFTQHLKD
jgi:hypothetical protein